MLTKGDHPAMTSLFFVLEDTRYLTQSQKQLKSPEQHPPNKHHENAHADICFIFALFEANAMKSLSVHCKAECQIKSEVLTRFLRLKLLHTDAVHVG